MAIETIDSDLAHSRVLTGSISDASVSVIMEKHNTNHTNTISERGKIYFRFSALFIVTWRGLSNQVHIDQAYSQVLPEIAAEAGVSYIMDDSVS